VPPTVVPLRTADAPSASNAASLRVTGSMPTMAMMPSVTAPIPTSICELAARNAVLGGAVRDTAAGTQNTIGTWPLGRPVHVRFPEPIIVPYVDGARNQDSIA